MVQLAAGAPCSWRAIVELHLAQRPGEVDRPLLAAPPLALSLTEQGMWLSLGTSSFDAAVELENRQQVLTSLTTDQQEAMAAFREKRPADYQGR